MPNMTNTQSFIPLGTVLAGVVCKRVDAVQLSGRIDRIRDDLKQFYRTLGKHEAEIEHLKAKL